MNLEKINGNNNKPHVIEEIDFDFKPITSGLGFHHPKQTEPKSVKMDRSVAKNQNPVQFQNTSSDASYHQSDLSIFYSRNNLEPTDQAFKEVEIKTLKLATKLERSLAYTLDLLFVASALSIVVTIMARSINMDLIEVWDSYPNEITPLVVSLFCGFYLLYFSIFEKGGQSTIGKAMFSIKVVSVNEKSLTLSCLLLRSIVSLLNFAGLGLFSYFDLQSKISSTKVVRKI